MGGPPPHGPDPDPAREGLQHLLWLLVLEHVAKPRVEMLRTSLPLHPILALPFGNGGEGTPRGGSRELVVLPGCPGGKGGLDQLVSTSIHVPGGDTCGA